MLMTALKEDYKRNQKEMPENIKEKEKRVKKKRKPKIVKEDVLLEKLYVRFLLYNYFIT